MFSRLNAPPQKQHAAAATKAKNAEDKYYNIYSFIDADVLVRCYEQDGPVFASSSGELPGTFATWKFTPGSELGDYKFQSYAFGSDIVADIEVGAKITVSSSGSPVQFRLQPSHGPDTPSLCRAQIKVTNEDLVWTIAGSGAKRAITLEKANGSRLQDFKIKETTPC
ncbi:hypothetical protein AURDEDRAFT_129450 [Auricularia subglabra TFB-10046 SS5]|nr:hypothetical protein AURDEDRAFT_129450 [Auricularia subglabra TFB-10046 SS5]